MELLTDILSFETDINRRIGDEILYQIERELVSRKALLLIYRYVSLFGEVGGVSGWLVDQEIRNE